MTNKQLSLAILLSVILLLATAQGTASNGTLALNSPLKITLPPSSPQTFNVSL
jgi:hypothetical protein